MCAQGDCRVAALRQDVISAPGREAPGAQPHRHRHWAVQLSPGVGRSVCGSRPGLWSPVTED